MDKCSYRHHVRRRSAIFSHIRRRSAKLTTFSVTYEQAYIQFSMRTCSHINHLREGLPISPTPFCAVHVAIPISLFVCRADQSVCYVKDMGVRAIAHTIYMAICSYLHDLHVLRLTHIAIRIRRYGYSTALPISQYVIAALISHLVMYEQLPILFCM
ncbi:hypothetical protein F4824DRAFT_372071 [Ustulina deusta]|nr:hypothetical protein F4824DRAFT_372071 [Ustulina deusta]